MAKVAIKKPHFIEDSDDETFLARLLMEAENTRLEIVHHINSSAFVDWSYAADDQDLTPMLILVDMNMPLQKGDIAIRRILADPRFFNVMIGMCSGLEDPADKRDAFAAGAQFFLQKPLNRTVLKKLFTRLKLHR